MQLGFNAVGGATSAIIWESRATDVKMGISQIPKARQLLQTSYFSNIDPLTMTLLLNADCEDFEWRHAWQNIGLSGRIVYPIQNRLSLSSISIRTRFA